MYKEYFEKNPQKYRGIKNLLIRSEEIRLERKEYADERLSKLEECRRIVDEKRAEQ